MATCIEEPAFFNLCDPLDGLSSIMPSTNMPSNSIPCT